MNKKYLIAIIVAAIVVVGMIIVIPSLGGDKNTAVTVPSVAEGSSAPPISPDATVPEGHPSVDGEAPADAASLDELVKTAEEAYNADPENVEAILALADAYVQAQKTEDATRLINEALALEPDNAEANSALAMIEFQGGDNAAAETRLLAVIEKDPEDQYALYNLGVIYFSTNQRDEAKVVWAKVAQIDPSNEIGSLASQFIQMMEQSGSSGASPHGASTDTTAQ